MIPISDNLKTYMRDGNGRHFEVKFVVNGSDFSCDIRKLKIKKGSCGSTLQPQTYLSNTIDTEIRTDTQLKHGDKLEVWLSAEASGDSSFYKVATAYVRHPARKKEQSFTAEGAITAKLGREYKNGVGSTVQAMIDNIEAETGANIILEDGMDASMVPNQAADLKGYLMREVLEDIAGLFFGYMTEDVDGNILIKTFRNNAEEYAEIKTERMATLPDVHDTVTVHGIQVKTTTADGQADYVYPSGVATVNCSLSNALMTEEIFNRYAGNFVGLTYTPYSVDVGLGDFSLEPFDCVLIDGKQTIITEIIHNIDGGISTTLGASTLNDGEEYSRTEKQMQSEMAYNNYPSAVSSGSSEDSPTIETEPERYAVDERLNASTTSGNTNLYIKDGYMAVLEINGTHSGYSNYVVEATANIDAKYMPAYPVKIFVRGYTAASGRSDGDKTATQYEILPELDERGKVRVVISTALLDPKKWSLTWDRYMNEDPSTSQLAYYAYYRFRVHWLLKSYVDSLKGTEETE